MENIEQRSATTVSSAASAWYDWEPGEGPKGAVGLKKSKSGAVPAKDNSRPNAKRSKKVTASPSKTALQGEWGEKKAEEWLKRNAGLVTIGRRVKVGRDELDLVMKTKKGVSRTPEIVFVEVKTRASKLFGGGLGAIDRRKRHALGRAASRWMMHNADCPMRIDLVEVYGDFETDRVDEVRHWEAAIPLERRINALSLGNRFF